VIDEGGAGGERHSGVVVVCVICVSSGAWRSPPCVAAAPVTQDVRGPGPRPPTPRHAGTRVQRPTEPGDDEHDVAVATAMSELNGHVVDDRHSKPRGGAMTVSKQRLNST
jgi:hypothetical protein